MNNITETIIYTEDEWATIYNDLVIDLNIGAISIDVITGTTPSVNYLKIGDGRKWNEIPFEG